MSKQLKRDLTQFHLRAPTLEDAEGIVSVHIACWQNNYRDLMDAEALANIPQEEWLERRRRCLQNPERVLRLIEHEKKVIGFCDGGPSRDQNYPDVAEIYALYVSPGFQGLGLGASLLSAVATTLKAQGFPRLMVKTLHTNPQSRGFYESAGGKFVGESSFEFGGRKYPEAIYVYDPFPR